MTKIDAGNTAGLSPGRPGLYLHFQIENCWEV